MKKHLLLLCLLCLGVLAGEARDITEQVRIEIAGQDDEPRKSKKEDKDTDKVNDDAEGTADKDEGKDRKNDKRKDRNEDKKEAVGKAEMTFDVTEHDFGAIPESGKKVSYEYVFTNTGDCPLVVTRVITSCKCVSTSFTKKPIPPGEIGVVTVTYDPKKQLGVFYKAIQVYSNASPKLSIIIAKGEVKN